MRLYCLMADCQHPTQHYYWRESKTPIHLKIFSCCWLMWAITFVVHYKYLNRLSYIIRTITSDTSVGEKYFVKPMLCHYTFFLSLITVQLPLKHTVCDRNRKREEVCPTFKQLSNGSDLVRSRLLYLILLKPLNCIHSSEILDTTVPGNCL